MNERNFSCGFSLINITIVLTIVIILITLSLPRLPFMQRYLIRAELEKIRILITYTQQVAITNNQEQNIIFDSNRQEYYTTDNKETLPRMIRFGIIPHVYGPPSKPTTPITNPITFVDQTLRCYPDGTISSGTLYLTDNNGNLYALTTPISEISFIRTYYYNGAWTSLS